MILDQMCHIQDYAAGLPHLAEALACLEQNRTSAPGRYSFPGGFLLIQEGVTAPLDAGAFEAHRSHLDVQILLEGAETMAWAEIDELTVAEPYDEQADKSLHTGDGCPIPIRPGMFYVCAPHDAHKACCHTAAPTRFRKAVLKLLLDT